MNQQTRNTLVRLIYRLQNRLTDLTDKLSGRPIANRSLTSSGKPRFTTYWDRSKEELVADLNAETRFKAYPDSYTESPDEPGYTSYVRLQFCGWAVFLCSNGVYTIEDTTG